MATTPNSIITVQTPKLDLLQFSTLDSTSVLKVLATGGVNGSKVTGLWVNNGDSTAHSVRVDITRSGSSFAGVVSTIPASAGFANGIPPVNMMAPAVWPGLPVDSDGNPFLFLQSTLDQLQALYTINLSTGVGATINLQAVKGDF